MAVKDGLGPRPVAQTAKRHFLNRLETSSQTLTLPPFLHCQLPPCSCPPGAGFRSAATLLVSSWSWLSFCTASIQAGVQGPCRRAKNTMAVKDGLGPRPVAQTAKRHFLNRLETSSQTLTLPPFLHPARVLLELAFVLQPPCSCPPGAGFRSAQLRSKLESKDPVAGLKHHGSEGRIGPAARSPDCQPSLSEPTRN